MLAIDTNVLVRLVARDDPDQVRVAMLAVGSGAWVSHVVLAEAVWVLGDAFGMSRAGIAETLGALLKHRNVVIQDSDVVVAALEQFKQRRKVEFTDCLILEIARKAGHAPLATFDRALAKLDGVEQL